MGMRIRGGGVARDLQALLGTGAVSSMGDGELLSRFLGRGESADPAFAALVSRHGRMVFRVCQDTLGDPHEAQDAAQATFFILARRAAAIRKPEALPSWLHGTARRVASRALRESIRRRRHERLSAKTSTKSPGSGSPQGWPELHEELARLPDRYREPIVLCDLTGLTHDQAASQLGCPLRTLETRLYRGRERLKDRLIRRGVAPSAAMVGVTWASETQAAMPAGWVASTASAAVLLAGKANWAAVEQGSAVAVRWARNHFKESAMSQLKLILASGLLVGLAWQQGGALVFPPKGEVATKSDATERNVIPTAANDPILPATSTHPVTVMGRAFDPEGKPIAGAVVFIASRAADYKRVAETTTDLEGQYQFDVALPIDRAETVTGRDHGAFQVFGTARGFGFAFRPVKWFYPNPKPSSLTYEPEPGADLPTRYEATDKIVLDLRFPKTSRLGGTIADDRGKPLPNILLEIRGCETGVQRNNDPHWSFDTLNERDSAPGSLKLRTTDALGRFEFDGLPVDCRFRIDLRSKEFPSQSIVAATASEAPLFYLGQPVQTGELKVTMAIPMDIPIRMIYDDTRMPAARVAVQAGGETVSILQSSDAEGRATLRLPRGKYRMSNWPARGTPYLITEAELVVGDEPPADPIVYPLRRAAELEVTVLDQATGLGLPGVDLWHQTADDPRKKFLMPSWEEATRIAWQDCPRTDDQGKVKVFAEPGKHRFGIGRDAYPRGYDVVESKGLEVECRAGETSRLRFTMKKRLR